MRNTFIDKNSDYKQQVFDMITNAFKNRVDDYLYIYKPIIANFIRKIESEKADNQQQENEVKKEESWKDERSFFQKYSHGNVIREIAWR